VTDNSAPESAAPVAVIGIGCRFPGGADSPASFWELLTGGEHTVGEVPEDRWKFYENFGASYAAALRKVIKRGAFLADIAGFDAEFFGISPREAELMDPQQRIMLEVSWEALEHAGIPPQQLAGTNTGVFAGVCTHDYGSRLLEDLPGIEAWTGIGAATCAIANRVSHALDLRGPSLAVDTACSASLVALHLACQSLRLGESTVALAGGVNLLVSPGQTLTLDSASALAPDGRSKCFDAAADGYGRGEGCGVLVLKLLADAQRDGDRVLGVILGSAVSQDGHTPGIMAPCGAAQEQVMTEACLRAGIAPGTVAYVEAHGTGTRLGDPLEAEALSAVYGAGRADGSPCLIGSVKSLIGHLEGAAGVAGVIKALLALQHGEIPPNLLATEVNPAIPWATSGLRVATEQTPWPAGPRPRRVGVSGFGYGGTVAHVVVEEAPDGSTGREVVPGGQDGQWRLYPLSAGSQAGLQEHAGRLGDWLPGAADVPLESLGHTLTLRRSHLSFRAVAAAAGRPALTDKLRRIAAGEAGEGVVTGSPLTEPGPGLIWIFSGHGSHWAGMGRELLNSEPHFASVIDALEPIFAAEIGFSPRQVLEEDALDAVDRIQTMIFAMHVGLAEVWRHYGATPAAVIGHSVGEIAAAVVSGALSLADGARLSCRRSRLLRRVAGKGAMALVALPFSEVAARLADRDDVVAAISSSPLSTVISGDIEAVEEVMTRWRAENIDIRKVDTDVAFHSPHMDPLLGDLAAAADGLSCGEPRIPMYVTALPDPRSAPVLDGSYWAANLRNPVLLAGAVTAAAQDGYRAFLEVSPHPVVTHSVAETLAECGVDDAFIQPSVRRNQPERETLLLSAATLHCRGIELDWERLQPGGELVTVPHISWQHRRHWRDPSTRPEAGEQQHDPESHTLLGSRMTVAGSTLRVWRTMLNFASRPYPGSHTMNGVEIVPAAVLVNTFLRVAPDGGQPPVLTEISMLRPLMTAETRQVQVVRDGTTLRLASRALTGNPADGPDPAWLVNTTARLASRDDGAPLAAALPQPPGSGLTEASPDLVMERLAAVGVPTAGFDWTITELHRGEGRLRARVRTTDGGRAPRSWAPALDAALSVGPASFAGTPVLRVAASVDEMRLTGAPPDEILVEAVVDLTREQTVDVLIADADGRVIGRLAGLRCPALDGDPSSAPGPRQLVHELAWRVTACDVSVNGGPTRGIVLIAPDAAAGRAIKDQLAAGGVSCQMLSAPEEMTRLGPGMTASVDVLVIPPRCEPDSSVTDAAIDSSWLLTRTAQVLSALSRAEFPRLWCLTTGVKESLTEPDLAHAPLWGLGRVLHGEHPEFWGGLIDLDPHDLAASVAAVPGVLHARLDEDVVAIRNGTALAPRLVRPEREPSHPPLECRPDSAYLVTGGLGTLGLEVARWLAERGARRIVLVGRRVFPPRDRWDSPADERTARQVLAIRAIEALGVTIKIVSLDISDARQAAALLTPDRTGFPPIRGIVHAAGVLDNRMAVDVDEDSLRTVMRPKAEGAWVLHRLFPPGTVDFFVLFSSCGQLLGLPGQTSYGAANTFLDALAAHRASYGDWDDTTCFGWTSWRGQGMAVNDVVDSELRAQGVADITAPDAFEAWDFASRLGAGHYAVLRVVGLESGTERPAVLSEVSTGDDAVNGPPPEEDNLSGLSLPQLRERVRDEVAAHIAREMKLAASDLDPRRPLVEQGLDSVMTLVIRRRLEKRFGHPLPATLLWQQPTITAIASHLSTMISETMNAAGNATPMS
jgi:6-methylsalicylic acid synthase